MAFLNAYPLPTPGFRQGTNNAIITSPNPQDQRKDNIRFDYRLNNANQFTFRYSRYNWTAVDAFRGDLPFARTDWERPNHTHDGDLDQHALQHADQRVDLHVLEGRRLHQRVHRGRRAPAQHARDQLSRTSSRRRKSSTRFRRSRSTASATIDGGPYPASSSGPIHTVANTTTWVKGRHTFKAGVQVEYSGEDDFDQINVSAIPGGTNNQNGRFEFRDSRAGGTGAAIANVALGLYSNYAELGQRNFTKWRALATDVFVQDSWKPTSALTIEGGFRYVYWPPWYSTTNNIANFDPRFYDHGERGGDQPARRAACISGPRYNGVVLPGDGFEGDAANSAAREQPGDPRAVPRRAARLLRDALERVRAAPRRELRDRRQDGRPRQRRHLPQPRDAERLDAARRQPAVPADGLDRQRHRRQPGRRRAAAPRTCRSASTARIRSSSTRRRTSTRSACSAKCRSASSSTSPTCIAAASTCSASATSTSSQPGTLHAQSGRQHRGAASLHGLRRDPHLGELGPFDVQQPADQRGPPLLERPEGRLRLHAGQVGGQRQRQAQHPLEHLRRHERSGARRSSTAVTCSTSTTSTICRSSAIRARA